MARKIFVGWYWDHNSDCLIKNQSYLGKGVGMIPPLGFIAQPLVSEYFQNFLSLKWIFFMDNVKDYQSTYKYILK